MKIEQFEKAEKIMEEIRKIDEFTKVFKESYNSYVEAEKAGKTTLDSPSKKHFRIIHGDFLYNGILELFEKRADELIEEFEKI